MKKPMRPTRSGVALDEKGLRLKVLKAETRLVERQILREEGRKQGHEYLSLSMPADLAMEMLFRLELLEARALLVERQFRRSLASQQVAPDREHQPR